MPGRPLITLCFLLLTFVSPAFQQQVCTPGFCDCFHAHVICGKLWREVFSRNKEIRFGWTYLITKFPDPLSLKVQDFTKSPSKISSVQFEEGCINTIDGDFFSRVFEPSIKQLIFKDITCLTSLPPASFKGLSTAFTELQLKNLPALKNIGVGTLGGVNSVEKITISGTKLQALPVDLFDGKTKLQSIDLSNNALTTLPQGIIAAQTATLNLNGNKWHCNCSLYFFRKDFHNTAGLNTLRCASPQHLAGRSYSSLSKDDLCPRTTTKKPAVEKSTPKSIKAQGKPEQRLDMAIVGGGIAGGVLLIIIIVVIVVFMCRKKKCVKKQMEDQFVAQYSQNNNHVDNSPEKKPFIPHV